MKLSEVTVFPKAYNVIGIKNNITSERLVGMGIEVGKEIKLCGRNKDLLIIAIGNKLADTITEIEAEQILIESR
jgi:hypothetical protein